MFISSNIRFLRKKAGLTQGELSAQIGKTSITISDYEKGKSVPPLEVALQFCRIFGADLDALVRKDLRKDGTMVSEDLATEYATRYEELKKMYDTLEEMNRLQRRRLVELEWMIRKHAPELAREIGLT